jgi:hypothetical protein
MSRGLRVTRFFFFFFFCSTLKVTSDNLFSISSSTYISTPLSSSSRAICNARGADTGLTRMKKRNEVKMWPHFRLRSNDSAPGQLFRTAHALLGHTENFCHVLNLLWRWYVFICAALPIFAWLMRSFFFFVCLSNLGYSFLWRGIYNHSTKEDSTTFHGT